jgi:hypothetical protein
MLFLSLMSCSTIQVNDTCPKYAPPVKPHIEWQDDGQRASLSIAEAVALARYLIEVDGYIEKTQ